MFPKSVGLIYFKYGKEPIKDIGNGGNYNNNNNNNLESDWTSPLSTTVKVDQGEFSLPVEPGGNGSRLHISMRGNSRCA